MDKTSLSRPKATDLFGASLIAAVFLGFFASIGILAAAIATFLVIAPLGAALAPAPTKLGHLET